MMKMALCLRISVSASILNNKIITQVGAKNCKYTEIPGTITLNRTGTVHSCKHEDQQ